MNMRAALLIVSGLIWSTAASADKPQLFENSSLIGRFSVTDLTPTLRLTVNLGEDIALSTHVMARFQNNRPQQRTENGEWVWWDETRNSLIDTQLTPNEDGTLTFDLVSQDLSQHFLPVIFTVAYQTEGGFKSGYVVIDQ